MVKYGKMYFLIAGYNTMSKEERSNFDVNGIANIFRNAMFGMALIMITGYFLSDWLNDPKIEKFTFYGSLLIGIPYLLINSNSDKFKINEKNKK